MNWGFLLQEGVTFKAGGLVFRRPVASGKDAASADFSVLLKFLELYSLIHEFIII